MLGIHVTEASGHVFRYRRRRRVGRRRRKRIRKERRQRGRREAVPKNVPLLESNRKSLATGFRRHDVNRIAKVALRVAN